jgi:predicted MFS family arabinose efflux permease
MVGPFLAGILIARLGEGLCFALNAASYVAVLAMLFMIRVPPGAVSAGKDSMTEAIATGMRYAWGTPAVRRVMLAIAMTASIGLAANTLTPALARDILLTGSQGYGRLLAGAGVGAILGALVAAGASTSRFTPLVNCLTLCGMGLALLGLGLARNLPLAAFCMMGLGSMSAIQFSTSNAYLQTSAPPHLRGRVVSMYVWIFQGMTPLGGFGAGWLASHAGIPPTILASGAACLLAGVALGATARRTGT